MSSRETPGEIPAAGSVLAGRYRLDEVLGRGGSSIVYRGIDLELHREIAVKVLTPGAVDPREARRQEEEIRLLARLDHPSLVTLFDFVRHDSGAIALVMRLVDGEDLGDLMSRQRLAPARVAALGADVADALAYLGTLGVIHRDIKPGNVLVPSRNTGSGPHALLADFGIARLSGATTLTAAGSIVGTAAYLSPEQALGSALTPATDVYSLGLVLAEALTGARSFDGTPAESIGARLVRDPAIPGDFGEQWTALLTAMTRRDPQSRPTPVAVAAALRSLAGSESAVTEGLAPTAVLPAPTLVATEVLPSPTLAATAELTEVLEAPRDAPRPASRGTAGLSRPRRVLPWVIGVVVLGLVVAGMTLAQRPSPPPPAEPTSEASPPVPESAPAEVVEAPFPHVPGKLGDRLDDLENAVEGTTTPLRDAALAVATASADARYEDAMSALHTLVVELDTAQDDGAIDEEAYRAIQSNAEQVEKELSKAIKSGSRPGQNDED